MRYFRLFLLSITLFLTSFSTSALAEDNNGHELISDEEIKARLSTIQNDVVRPKFDPAVRSYINTYTVKHRDRTERMLGRTVIYFPMFEEMLLDAGLPTDLKYLSVVESALNAQAVSRSGAVGLWQFMKPTGRECGLSINRTVDERKDPEKATRAAIQYLAKQYKRYGNWELALAAYNGGAGRVNRAIKRGRSKNFWKIRRHLPRETRNYIPAYIAATYINYYFQDHELNPLYPDAEFQTTESIKVYRMLTFAEVEAITGTPEYIIEFLNPSYKKLYLPASVAGNNLVLPQADMATFRSHFQLPDSDNRRYTAGGRIIVPSPKPVAPANSMSLYYSVENGDDMQALAQSFYCSEMDIMKWNKLTSRKLRTGQQLLIYVSRDALQPINLLTPLNLLEAKPVQTNFEETIAWKPIPLPLIVKSKKKKNRRKAKRKAKKSKQKGFVYHKIKRGESLHNIAAQYEGVSVNDLIELNNIQSAESLQTGMKLKVKKK